MKSSAANRSLGGNWHLCRWRASCVCYLREHCRPTEVSGGVEFMTLSSHFIDAMQRAG